MRISETPVTDALSKEYVFVDNEMQSALNLIGWRDICRQAGLSKRSGDSLPSVLLALLIWPLLGVNSLAAFCGKFVEVYLRGGLHVLYDFLKREDVNWERIGLLSAKVVYDQHQLGAEPLSAFVADDSLKQRRGKKVEAVSSHFDHTTGRCVMGQQVVQLGLATIKGMLPVAQQIFLGTSKRQELQKPFKDARRAVGRSYKRADELSKHEIMRHMLSQAINAGILAKHMLADAWFGTKGNIAAVLEHELIGIFMMKRGNLRYRFQGRFYSAQMLYELVKRRMRAERGQRFLTYSLNVQLDLDETPDGEPQWREVRLLFSKPRQCASGTYVVLLCTETGYTNEQILKVYALRWSIEVYFKEVKQHMGWLSEQTGRYSVHYASIHLAAIRYLLLYNLLLHEDQLCFGEVRDRVTGKLQKLSFAVVLWELFKRLIHGVLKGFTEQLGGKAVNQIYSAIDQTVEAFLRAALQMDDTSVANQLKAEAMGAL